MTTPDPVPGPGPTSETPDDATSAFDAAPWPPSDTAAPRAPSDPAALSPAADAAPRPAEVAAAPGAPAPAAAAPASATTAGPVPAPPWPAAGAPAVPPSSGTVLPGQGSAPPTPGSAPQAAAWPAAGSVPPPGSVPLAGSVPSPGGQAPPPWAGSYGRALAEPRRSTPAGLVAGIVLVVVGAALLVSRVVELQLGSVTWPLWIIIPGVTMLVGSFFIPPRGGLGLAIPGAILTMVGLVLWVQEAYGLYSTWAYAWALVAPTAPGLAMLLYGLVHRDGELAADGLRITLVGLGLFLGFALFFEGVVGLNAGPLSNLEQVLPYAVIGLGVLLVVLSFFGGGTDGGARREQRRRERDERRARRHGYNG